MLVSLVRWIGSELRRALLGVKMIEILKEFASQIR